MDIKERFQAQITEESLLAKLSGNQRVLAPIFVSIVIDFAANSHSIVGV